MSDSVEPTDSDIRNLLQGMRGRLMDSQVFCKTAYDIFDLIARSPGGEEKLRLRKNRDINRLMKEVIPIAGYMRLNFSSEIKLMVSWVDAEYDAYLKEREIKKEGSPRPYFLEVTTAVRDNDHLARQYLHEHGVVGWAKGISRDKQTKQIKYIPVCCDSGNCEAERDFAEIIRNIIQKKAGKNYPNGTLLIIHCDLDFLYFPAEWDFIVRTVRESRIKHNFQDIVLLKTKQYNHDGNHDFFEMSYL
jgi:hypothetical protein